jgi:type IV pilus assembly protein PilV
MDMRRSKAGQNGLVLLESLVAILIFSIGILALVGMQASAINNVSDSKYRSTAGFLADSIIGTIWATSPVLINDSNVSESKPDPNFCTPACAGTTASSPAVIAWVSGVMDALPNASGANAPTIAVSGAMVTVTVSWQPPRSPTVHRHSVTAFVN